ncbi:MAG: hypothetical protein AUK39_01970 [Dehalococcoidia bacterium CG2_30_46_19]|nr:MAG: hypothetical protein AUK39_01970 [Dehalococcoidia bacterium CG2_30_46_19]
MEIKNKTLLNIAEALVARKDEILAVNKIDYDKAKASGLLTCQKNYLRMKKIKKRIGDFKETRGIAYQAIHQFSIC